MNARLPRVKPPAFKPAFSPVKSVRLAKGIRVKPPTMPKPAGIRSTSLGTIKATPVTTLGGMYRSGRLK